MAVQLNPMIFNRFKGIREYNGVNAENEISALVCENVELFNSEIGAEVGIKTIEGNSIAYAVNTNYKIIGIFSSAQKITENSDSYTKYFFIYAEHITDTTGEDVGKLYYINSLGAVAEVEGATFTKTGQCNGLTMTSTAYDVFIFTNGIEAYSISFAETPKVKPINFSYGWENNGTTIYTLDYNPAVDDYIYDIDTNKTVNQITSVNTSDGDVISIVVNATTYTRANSGEKIFKKDYLGHDIKFIAMDEFKGYLTVVTKHGVRASHQNNIYKWNDNPTGAADSWYIDYSKPVTALYAYTGGLFIFTGDTTDFITDSPNISGVSLQNTAGIGCYNYQSIVKHDTYLFFYDNNQKNIYYIQNIDNGQTRPAGPIAKEIQSEFKSVDTFKMYSCIYNTRNEIWCLINKKVFVYDYFQNEWLERKHQEVNSLLMTNNTVYASSDNVVLSENKGSYFNDVYYPSVYQTTFINAGSNTNLKKQKTPLLIIMNNNYTNRFYVRLIVNGKLKSEKFVNKSSTKQEGFYYIEQDDGTIPDTMKYGTAKYAGADNPYSKIVTEISTPQTWYTLAVKIYTKEHGDGFCICSMELKNMKAKLKTKGR